jgi:hypothetical protein
MDWLPTKILYRNTIFFLWLMTPGAIFVFAHAHLVKESPFYFRSENPYERISEVAPSNMNIAKMKNMRGEGNSQLKLRVEPCWLGGSLPHSRKIWMR